MAHFLFNSLVSVGHYSPLVPIAQVLQDAGHDVTFALDAPAQIPLDHLGFPTRVLGQGMTIHAYLKSYPKIDQFGPSAKLNHLMQEVILPQALQMQDGLSALYAAQPYDVVVSDLFAFGGRFFAERNNIPWALVSVFPSWFRLPHWPPYPLGWRPSGSFVGLMWYRLVNRLIEWRLSPVDQAINHARQQLGLNRITKPFGEGTLSPYLNLPLWPDCYDYPLELPDKKIHRVGASLWSYHPRALDVSWIHSLPQTKPVVYATFGTVQPRYRQKVLSIVIRALEGLDIDAVVACGWDNDPKDFKSQSSHVKVIPYVPNDIMIPKSSVVIHHGGYGTTQMCLKCGVPALIIPFVIDQHEHAARCRYHRLARRLPSHLVSIRRIRKTIRSLLDNSVEAKNCQNWRDSVDCDGHIQAAYLLKKCLID